VKPSFAHLERYRVREMSLWSSARGDRFGVFSIPFHRIGLKGGSLMVCVATEGNAEIPWEHVSLRIDLPDGTQRCPTWAEMSAAKDLFWCDDECVIQFHPPKAEYVNNHPFVLHLWRPIGVPIPRPPTIALGVVS